MIRSLALVQCGCGEYTQAGESGAVRWWMELQSEKEKVTWSAEQGSGDWHSVALTGAAA